ncbi:hypothetical protein HRD49_12150 [Corallococcus exiguus]|uniref:hypothetical protein n=1 Tax=Corallococcus exiguus TaxID=83462 RepID=UPI00155FE30E|nr:hypothetical protein [Corallococcus exiguus]NRD52518.1 hypothetical protein [Corallococcus exiguus]NRD62498.1 hypothetical protein [Corallococcus exiguus]
MPEAFDARWEHWLDHSEGWTGFFEKLESLAGRDLTKLLRAFEVVLKRDVKAYGKLRRSAEGRAGSVEHVDPIFFGDAKTAAMKILGA